MTTSTTAATVSDHPHDSIHDVVIVGAGPVGLFAVFELGLLGLRALVIDVLPHAGGQCIELYPDKPIYDIPGLPSCTGATLTHNLLAQIKPFAPMWSLGRRVLKIEPNGHDADTPLWTITTDDPTHPKVQGKTVVFATGAGEFTPKALDVPDRARFEGRTLLYALRDPTVCDNRRVLVVGGGDSAVDWTLALVDRAAHVTLLHRRADYRAAPAMVETLRARASHDHKLQLLTGSVQALHGDAAHTLTHATVATTDATASTMDLPVDVVLVFYGLTIKSGAVLEHSGLVHERGLVCVDTEQFASNLPGVYAIGDANTYRGKLKLILCGFHEAALMARAAYKHIHKGTTPRFEYTTTSSTLKRRLNATNDAAS